MEKQDKCEQWVTVRELAGILHCSRSTIYRWLKLGAFRDAECVIKVGSDWRFDPRGVIEQLMVR